MAFSEISHETRIICGFYLFVFVHNTVDNIALAGTNKKNTHGEHNCVRSRFAN